MNQQKIKVNFTVPVLKHATDLNVAILPQRNNGLVGLISCCRVSPIDRVSCTYGNDFENKNHPWI